MVEYIEKNNEREQKYEKSWGIYEKSYSRLAS